MKKITYIFLIILFTSCDYTDIQPVGKTLPTDISALKAMLNDNYSNYCPGNQLYMLPEMEVKVGTQFGRTPGITIADFIYNFEDYFFDPTQASSDIDMHSAELNRLNVILDNIEKAEASKADYNLVKQTALLRRAHIYYTFINTFCPQYTPENANIEKLGWVNKYTEKYDADLTRMTLAESFQLMIQDIEEALKIDMPRQEYADYGSTNAAIGLLAMVYMNMGDYENALKYCNQALANYSFLYDYSTMDPETITSDIEIHKSIDFESIISRGGYCALNKGEYDLNNGYCSTDFISLFEVEDMRRNFLVIVGNDIKWFGARRNNFSANCSVPLLLLYKAECLARDNQVSEAMKTVNVLREKRFISGSDFELSATDKEEALKLIYEESRRELAFSFHSFTNVRRLNFLHNAGISVERKHTQTGETIKLEAKDPKWTLPIPRYYIELNPELTQNPRN